MSKDSNRNYGVDLLRICATLMIVMLHILGRGGIIENCTRFSLRFDITVWLEVFCLCAVNCYGLITGYVTNRSNIKYRKIINMWLGVAFWTISLTLFFYFRHPGEIMKRNIVRSFLPITFSNYWYFSSYFILFFFIPYLNRLVDHLSQKEYKRLLGLILVLFGMVGLITDPFKTLQGYSFIWLACLYLIGAYISRYNPLEKVQAIKLINNIIFSVCVTFFSIYFMLEHPKASFGYFSSSVLFNYCSIFMVIMAVSLLELFKRIKLKDGMIRLTKFLTPTSFGVYIIHVQTYAWIYIMHDRFTFMLQYNTLIMVFLIFLFTFIVYMVCSCLELFRIRLFKCLKVTVFVDKICEWWERILLIIK